MTEEKIKLLIADDHAILRHGLKRILEAEPDMSVIGEAATGVDAVKRAKQLKPDVVIMDISMPEQDGIESMRQIMKAVPSRVLILTVHLEHHVISEAVSAGAAGYLVKAGFSRSGTHRRGENDRSWRHRFLIQRFQTPRRIVPVSSVSWRHRAAIARSAHDERTRSVPFACGRQDTERSGEFTFRESEDGPHASPAHHGKAESANDNGIDPVCSATGANQNSLISFGPPSESFPTSVRGKSAAPGSPSRLLRRLGNLQRGTPDP